MNKNTIFLIWCVTIGFAAITGFSCGIMLSKMIDIIREIEIVNISGTVIIASVFLLGCIIWSLRRLTREKCLGFRIPKKDIIIKYLLPTIFIPAFAFVCALIRYLGIRSIYFYAVAGILTICLFALLTKHLVKTQRKKDQSYYYKFWLIFIFCLVIGLLAGLIF